MATDKKNTNSDPSLPVYIIYARKSKFTGKGESIQNQIDCCKNKILQMAAISNTTLSEEQILIFQDEGFSGGNTDRPVSYTHLDVYKRQVHSNALRDAQKSCKA